MVDGHELHEEDLRLMHTFNQASGSAAQYEAHSDSQVTPTVFSSIFHFQHKLGVHQLSQLLLNFFFLFFLSIVS